MPSAETTLAHNLYFSIKQISISHALLSRSCQSGGFFVCRSFFLGENAILVILPLINCKIVTNYFLRNPVFSTHSFVDLKISVKSTTKEKKKKPSINHKKKIQYKVYIYNCISGWTLNLEKIHTSWRLANFYLFERILWKMQSSVLVFLN